MLVKTHSIGAALILLVISSTWTFVFTRKLLRVLEDRRRYQLGFDGERYVGEELSRLIAFGFEIYHDVPFDGFNIDHVLVGKPGIFIVETKTRRKPVNEIGDKEYHVVCDGKSLRWPWGAENQDIQQTVNSADTFSKWLSKAMGERVVVSSILTLPGWWIDLTAPCKNPYVLNPKQIITFAVPKRKNSTIR